MQSQCQSRITSARALGFPDIIRGNPGPTDQRAQRHGNWATASRYFVHATSIGSFSESLLKLSKAKVQEREREREREREAHGFRRPMEICAHHPLRVICPPARAALGRQIAAGVARTGKELPSNLLFSRPSLSLSLSLSITLSLSFSSGERGRMRRAFPRRRSRETISRRGRFRSERARARDIRRRVGEGKEGGGDTRARKSSPGHRVYLVIPTAGYIPRTRAPAGSTLSDLYSRPLVPLPPIARPPLGGVSRERGLPFSSVSAGRLRAGCGTSAINLSRHAIIFVPGAGVYARGKGGRAERGRARARPCACARTARDSRARDNDNTGWAPRVCTRPRKRARSTRVSIAMAWISRRRSHASGQARELFPGGGEGGGMVVTILERRKEGSLGKALDDISVCFT